MKSDIDIILFLLETLRFRHKLEEQLINNLSKLNSKNISRSQLEELYGEKVNEELLASTESALRRIGVLVQNNDKLIIDPIKLERFKELIETAKAARDYKWPSINPKPFLYVSPPSLITSNVSSEVDDIANLLVNLVRSAEQNISIMSPFTNESGLQSVFAPLQACKNTPEISIYLISYTKKQRRLC